VSRRQSAGEMQLSAALVQWKCSKPMPLSPDPSFDREFQVSFTHKQIFLCVCACVRTENTELSTHSKSATADKRLFVQHAGRLCQRDALRDEFSFPAKPGRTREPLLSDIWKTKMPPVMMKVEHMTTPKPRTNMPVQEVAPCLS
jgi:hypothetical protein